MEEKQQTHEMIYGNHSSEAKQFVFFGVVLSFITGSIMHWIGSVFGGFVIFDGIVPLNESIWEHLKLAFYPSLFFMLYPWCDYVRRIPVSKRVCMAAVSAVLSQLIIWFGYYGLKDGVNVSGIIVDLVLYGIGLVVGFIHAAMISDDDIWDWVTKLSALYLVIMTVCNYLFAFAPPNLPIFVPL